VPPKEVVEALMLANFSQLTAVKVPVRMQLSRCSASLLARVKTLLRVDGRVEFLIRAAPLAFSVNLGNPDAVA
jgi:hypothetical protein